MYFSLETKFFQFVRSTAHKLFYCSFLTLKLCKFENLFCRETLNFSSLSNQIKKENSFLLIYSKETFTFDNYSGVHIRIDKPCFMKQMSCFWPSLIGNKNAITPLPFRVHFSIDCSFKMRYCMNFYLNWHRNYRTRFIDARSVTKPML